MPRNFAGSGSSMAGTAVFTGTGTFIGWVRVATVAQQGSQFAYQNDGGSVNITMVGTDRVAATGKVTAYQSKSGTSAAATTAVALTANTWQLFVGAFGAYPNTQVAYLVGSANKKITSANVNPPGINAFQIGGRGTFDIAHVAALSRLPTDLEVDALNSVFLNPRALGLTHYWYVNQTTTENDQVGSINLTVTGTNSVSGDPNIATWFTGTAIANQSWTQNSAITTVDLTTKFDNGVAATAPWTGTLKQLGAAGTTTTASVAGAASTALQTAVALTAGQWITVGTNALTPVLYVSGTTALLGTALTWNAGDTVTPYPVNSLTITGISVNGSNVLTGTPTVNGTFSNCLIRATNNTNSAAIADSNLFSINIASSGATASFTAGPTLTNATTDGYVFGATSNQTGTWYTCILAKGSPSLTGSPASVRTGSPTGFISRFNVAVTAATPATQTVTALTFPFHDVYHVINNGNGDSAVSSNLALFKLPPTGSQYVTLSLNTISAITKANPVVITTSSAHGYSSGNWIEVFGAGGMTQINGAWAICTVIDSTHFSLPIDSTGYTTYTSGGNVTWGRSSIKDSSTVLVSGDILVADATDGQGNAVTFTPEGVAIFATTSTARQSFNKNAYDISTAGFVGTALDFENDSPPIAPGGIGGFPYVLFPLNQQVSQSIASYFSDPQGDDLTQSGRITALTSLPVNRTLSAGVLSGIATTAAVTAVTFQATNASGESSSFVLNVVDGGVAVPNGIGLDSQTADALTTANFLVTAPFGQQDDPNPAGPAPIGIVIAQTPAAGTIVTPGTSVTYTLSTGNAPQKNVPPPVAAPTLKSPQLQQEEILNALQSYGVFKPIGVCYLGPNDAPGTVYRFFRLPSSARITHLQIVSDPNPTGSIYKLGLLGINGGGLIVPGSDRILFPSVSLDTARNGWTDIFIPATASGPASILNMGKRVWELLGLTKDPATLPTQASQDVLYDVALTAVTPGTTGGYVAISMEYSRGPDRGMIAGAGTIGVI